MFSREGRYMRALAVVCACPPPTPDGVNGKCPAVALTKKYRTWGWGALRNLSRATKYLLPVLSINKNNLMIIND